MHIKSNHIELRDKMFAYTEDIEEFKSRMTPLEFERECLIFSGTEAEEIKKLMKAGIKFIHMDTMFTYLNKKL
mgnify:CR=1 FL=1